MTTATNIHYIIDLRSARAEIRKQLDIVKVIADDLGPPVKQSGQDSFYMCPFHGEIKNPSFGVHQQLQIYKCFGCSQGGDVVSWTQNYFGMSVPEAIEKLAATYNVDLSAYYRPPTPEELQQQKYHTICETASKFLSKSLFSNQEIYNWYMNDTGFDIDQVVTYDVGYSNSPDTLIQHIFSTIKDVTQDEIARLEFDNRLQWSNSLVYPIRDAMGLVSRFYTKPLSNSEAGGKYIGTTHLHPLFSHKLIFGFNVLRKDLRKNNYSVRICEGFKAAIASGGGAVMGTTIHEEQIKLLKDHNIKEIKVAFDGDSAGRAASMRLLDNINIFSGINVLLTNIPTDRQPDSIRKEFGKEALDIIFNTSVLPIQFFVDLKRDSEGSLTIENKFSLVNELRDHLINISDVQLDLTSKYLSEVLGVDPGSIKEYVTDVKLTGTGLLNRDAEQAVLQTVMLNPKMWSSLKQAISDVKVFTGSGHQYLYSSMDIAHRKARDNGTADSVTVQVIRDEMKLNYPQWPEIYKIIDTVLSVQSKYEFTDALLRIIDLYRRRQGIEQSRHLQATLQDLAKPTNEIMSKYRRNMVSSMDIKKDDTSTPPTLADATRREIEERSMRKSAIIGHDFSLVRDIDGKDHVCMAGTCLALSGIQKGHQIIISANSGVGKSILGLQIATSMSVCPPVEDQVPVLWIPIEMTPVEIAMRQVSLISGINNSKVQAGMLTQIEQDRVTKALDMIAKSQFYCRKPKTCSIDEIFAIIDEYNFKYGIKGVILDYIQLIASGDQDKGLSREQVISRASHVMKNQVAEDMKIFSICISQQNRSNFVEGEPGRIENIGGAYTLAQDADDVLLLAELTSDQMSDLKNGANRKSFIDKRRGGSSDISIDFYLDVDKNVDLRCTECLTPNQMLSLSKGLKV